MSKPFDLSAWAERDERARAVAGERALRFERALACLRSILEAYGVREAYVFGSMVQGAPRAGSDIDVAVSGCPPERFYRLGAELERALAAPLDLVDLDRAPNDWAAAIRQRGRRIDRQIREGS